jgi:ferric-dicitrate binding protein FerR (iron transport regulator)
MNKEYFIKKWLTNTLTDEELNEFKKLEDYDLNEKIIEKAEYFKASHFSSVKNFDKFKEQLPTKETPVKRFVPYKRFYKIAGLFIMALSIYFIFFFNNLTTVKTLASQKSSFELPDASIVMLNAESKAKYSKKKWSDKRELNLDGEAFFKVAKGSKFDVNTSNGTVTVVGTQFNVKSRKHYFEVICFQGIVNVKTKGRENKLLKGMTLRIINKVMSLDSVNGAQPKWLNNISSFKSVPLSEVLDEFERQYNVIIQTDKVDTQRLFTGGFTQKDLDQALNSITIPFNLSYKKDNSNKIILYSSE